MKTLNDSPARYAAQLAETIGSLHRHLAAEQPDWWQQVVAELHSRLDKEFPPFYGDTPDFIPPWKGRPDRECPVCSEPEDKLHAPDCEYAVLDSLHLPGMENSRLNAMDWRFNGIDERLGTLENNASAFRLTALEERLAALEDWTDIDFTAPANNGTPDCIHNLIAEGMTGVTRHAESRIESLSERLAIWEQWAAKQEKRIDDTLHFCDESAVALVTVLGNATDKRIDAVVKQTELLQSLVLNVKELLLNVDARLDDLETARPC